jgi:adenosylcobinamide kinase/adenosylcobinamide-phosphate guanylyltransferase
VILVGGGARSGKSRFALGLARCLGSQKAFLATAEARDQEMAGRIAHHQRQRGSDFETIEEPIEVATALERIEADVVVVDCLTLWLANLMLRGDEPERVLNQVDNLMAALRGLPRHVILVTNEVGMGIVPDNPLGRAFRDVCGTAHQRLSRTADEVYFAVLGTILRLKPGPVEVCSAEDLK